MRLLRSLKNIISLLLLIFISGAAYSSGQKEDKKTNKLGGSFLAMDLVNPFGVTRGMGFDDVRKVFSDVGFDTNGFFQAELSDSYYPFASVSIETDTQQRTYLLVMTSDIQVIELGSDVLDLTFYAVADRISSRYGEPILEGFDNAMETPGLQRILDRNAKLVVVWSTDGAHLNIVLVQEQSSERSGYFNLYLWLN